MKDNEVTLFRRTSDRYTPWRASLRNRDHWNESMLCGDTVARLMRIPKRVLVVVLVFSRTRTPHSWQFKKHLSIMHPFTIMGTNKIALYHGMDSELRKQWELGNRFFRFEYV